MLEAIVSETGDVLVEGQHVGTLQGFRFMAAAGASGAEMTALNAAAAGAIVSEVESRAAKMVLGGDDTLVLSNDGFLRWSGEPVARLGAGEQLLHPQLHLLSDENLAGAALEQVQTRLTNWLNAHIAKLLGPLQALEAPSELTGAALSIASQIALALGVLERNRVSAEVKTLDQEARASLRHLGIRFGAYHLYLPNLLKPAPRALAALLWSLKHDGPEAKGLTEIVHLAASGRTSIPVDKEASRALYRAGGFRVCGERALRVDILERLADLIRPAANYRPGITQGEPPAGAADGEGFVVTGAMTSLVGCSGPDFASVLNSLGYTSKTRPGPAITVPLAVAPVVEVEAVAAPEGATETPPAEAETVVAETAVPEIVVDVPVVDLPAAIPAEDAPQAAAAEELPSEQVAAPDVSEATAPVETEIWQQNRTQHHDNRRPQQRHARPSGPQRDGQARAEGEAAAQPRPAREDQRRSKPHYRKPQEEGAERPAHQGDKRRDDRNKFGRGDAARNEARRDGAKGGGYKGNNPRDGQKQWNSAPPPKERLPDPNSPFAKLLALKADMETRGKS